MKLRRAQSVEAPVLADILVEGHGRSRYNGVCEVDKPLARKILAGAIHRHGGKNEGATFVNVAENAEGEVVAFIVGEISRIYGVCDRFCSTDQFLLGREGVSAHVLNSLFSRYIEWASQSPKVIEIGGSWCDTIEGSEGFAGVLEMRGFRKISESFIRNADEVRAEMIEEAA